MEIRELRTAAWPLWDAYIRGAAGGLPHHLAGWQSVLALTYGYTTHYLGAWDADELVGALPLFAVDSPLLGRTLTTLPGGLCADSPAAGALLEHAQQLACATHAKRLVLHDTRQVWNGAWQTVCDHESWQVDLTGGEDALPQRVDRNIRRQVRMAERNGLTAVVDRSGERLDDFYCVLSRFMHQAGTPIFSRKFLQNVVETFPAGFNMALVYRDREPIGGYFQLEMGDTVYGAWGATLHEYLELRPVYLAYWTILVDAARNGFRRLDMGRSPAGSSASKYKGQWATQMTPIYQQTWTPHRDGVRSAASAAQQAQTDARFRMVRRVWPKLPYWVAQQLGPLLRRHVPFA
jgi:FemAB-related protein (PEP-CTERM system-associated)